MSGDHPQLLMPQSLIQRSVVFFHTIYYNLPFMRAFSKKPLICSFTLSIHSWRRNSRPILQVPKTKCYNKYFLQNSLKIYSTGEGLLYKHGLNTPLALLTEGISMQPHTPSSVPLPRHIMGGLHSAHEPLFDTPALGN